ncbi:MAG: glutamyl-tRNA reductase [Gemmatimonadales bacterium]
MTVTVIGVNHRTAPIEIRERLAWPASEVPGVLSQIAGAQGYPVALLSTCNRIEFYLGSSSVAAREAVWEAVWEAAAYRLGESVKPHAYVHEGRDAVRHVFRVAAGLDSMILGEAQVQGQVRDAWEAARGYAGPRDAWEAARGYAGPILARLFQAALNVGGRVRAETTIGRGAASVPSASVDLAKKIFGQLKGRRALVLGSGEMAELATACLVGAGVEATVVAHLHLEQAENIAAKLGGEAVAFDDAWERFASVDIVLTSTAAPNAIVTPDKVREAITARNRRPLCILDIAVPRDVDPEVGNLPNVLLYDIDDLQGVVDATLSSRQERVPAADEIVGEETDRFWEWYQGRRVVGVVRALRDNAERMRLHELQRAMKKLGHLSPQDREQVEYLTKALLQKFLHTPTIRLRGATGNGTANDIAEALRYAFDLSDPAEHDKETEESETE